MYEKKPRRIPFGCMLAGTVLGALVGYFCVPYYFRPESGRRIVWEFEAVDRRANHTLAAAILGAIAGMIYDFRVNGKPRLKFQITLPKILLAIGAVGCVIAGIKIYLNLEINPLTW